LVILTVKRAIVSDIHGNLEALEAVLADIAKESVDSIYCLGDIVGYGPNPRECIDRVISFDQSILGNHDQGALYDPEDPATLSQILETAGRRLGDQRPEGSSKA